MTVKEAAALLGVPDKRIYRLVQLGLIRHERLEATNPSGNRLVEILSTEEELREANDSVRTVPKREQKLNPVQGEYLTMPQLAKLLGVTIAAAGSRVRNRGLRSKCIEVGGKLAISRRLAEKLAKDGYQRVPGGRKTDEPKTKKPTAVVSSAPPVFMKRIEEIQVKLSEIEEMLGLMMSAWGLKR